jgi:hypothetical protein
MHAVRIVIKIEGVEDASSIVVRVGRGDDSATVQPATRLVSTVDTEAIDAGPVPDSVVAALSRPTETEEPAEGAGEGAGGGPDTY